LRPDQNSPHLVNGRQDERLELDPATILTDDWRTALTRGQLHGRGSAVNVGFELETVVQANFDTKAKFCLGFVWGKSPFLAFL
jgi:hypothetical protein